MADKKGVLSADKTSVSLTDATISDAASTLLSTNEVVFGTTALVQRVGLFVGGMAYQAWRLTGSANPFVKAQ